MKTDNHPGTPATLVASLLTIAALTSPIHADLRIYEGFDYGASTIDGTQSGGIGLAATGWSGTTSNVPYSVLSGGLSFTDLSPAPIGGKLKRASAPGAAEVSRGLEATAQTALTADNTTIYFSLLMENNRFSTGNANDAFVIGTGPLTDANSKPVALAGGEGFGVFFKGYGASPSGSIDIAGIAFDEGVAQVSTGLIDTDITSGPAGVYFIVGKIDWAPDGSNDTLSLYNVTNVNVPLPAPFATLSADLDQSAFDTLAFGGAQVGAFDEIRIGDTALDVGMSEDATAPTTVDTNPQDDESGVLVSSDLVATFSEDIAFEDGGSITIRDLGAGPDLVITLPDATGQVSVSGPNLTINPTGNLVAGNNYAIQISANAVKDLADPANFFAGIPNDDDWSFQTAADGTAPTIATLNPADNTTGASVGTDLVATFSETVMAGAGNITVKNITEGTETVLPVADAQVTVSSTDLTVDLAVNLEPGDDYAIRIDAGAVTDTTGNPFAGITNDDDWNFTTGADTTAPTIVGLSPADGGGDVVLSADLVATFSEDIAIGTGNITIRNLTDGSGADVTIDVTDTGQVSVSGAELIIDPAANLLEDKDYAVRIDGTAVDDLLGNSFAGIGDDTTWNFATPSVVTGGLLIDEPFDYSDGTINGVSTYGGGTGLAGTWVGSTTNVPFSMSDGTGHSHGGAGESGLTFPGLKTTGSVTLTRKAAPGGAEVHRQVAAAVLPSLIADDSTVYFSVLVRTKYYSVGNENLAFSFGTDDVFNPNAKPVTSPGEAIGFALKGSGSTIDFQALAVDDGSTSVSALGGLATATPTIFLIVGEIQWAAGTDTINLYNVTNVTAPLPAAFASLSADLDQSQFDTISVAGQQVSSLDEIRFGTSLSDVLPEGGVVNNFDSWIAMFPGAASDTSFGGDPDGDGNESGLENFFGTDPGAFTAGLSAGTYTTNDGNKFTFTHLQNATPAVDVSAPVYSWSTDLDTFYGNGASNGAGTTTVSFSAAVDTPVAGTTTVTATITGTVIPDKLFVDVGVTQL